MEPENIDSQTDEQTEETPVTEEAVAPLVPPTEKEGETKEEFSDREKQYYERIKKLEEENADLKTQAEGTDDFVKKSDLEADNEALARKALEESNSPADKEILEDWAEIAEVYTKVATRGKNTKEAVMEDLRDAHAVYSRGKVKHVDTSASAAEIAAMRGVKAPSAPSTDTAPAGKKLLRTGNKMDDWYPTPES